MGYHGGNCASVYQIAFLDNEVATLEERSDGTTQQQRTQQTVERQEELEGLGTKEVAQLVLELITDSLQHKSEEDNHP